MKKTEKKTAAISGKRKIKKKSSRRWSLKLYVAGLTGKSETAFQNLKSICEEHLKGHYQIEVIDLVASPQLARGDQIFAIPTLIKQVPKPVRKIIGDLSDTEKVLVGLNIKQLDSE